VLTSAALIICINIY